MKAELPPTVVIYLPQEDVLMTPTKRLMGPFVVLGVFLAGTGCPKKNTDTGTEDAGNNMMPSSSSTGATFPIEPTSPSSSNS